MSGFPSPCMPSVALPPLNWGTGNTPVTCSGNSTGSNLIPYHSKFLKWTGVFLLGGAPPSTAGMTGAQAGRDCAVCLLSGCSEGPKDICRWNTPVVHLPCITDKSYSHFLCGHHIPVLLSHYAPGRKSFELCHQSAKPLKSKPFHKVTVCLYIHYFNDCHWIYQSVSAVLTVVLVQDRNNTQLSVSWVDTSISETVVLFSLPLLQKQFQATVVILLSYSMSLTTGLGH